jgi:hypothetical protein
MPRGGVQLRAAVKTTSQPRYVPTSRTARRVAVNTGVVKSDGLPSRSLSELQRQVAPEGAADDDEE